MTRSPHPPALATVEEALDALRDGRPVLVVDDADRENEGDVVLAAQTLTPEWTAWAVRHTSGYLCAPMPETTADRLGLPLMVADNRDPLGTAYTVTVDAAVGVTTGISAADRTRTAQVLADPSSTAADLRRPGHVVPLRAREGGVLVRPGHTEATVDLCRLAGLEPVGVIGELVEDDGAMTRLDGVLALGAEHDLPVLTIADLVGWRQRHDRVHRVADTVVPTAHGRFRALAYRDGLTGEEHLALVGPRGAGEGPTLVRVHSECLTGDVLGSQRCDCGPQLDRALERVALEGGAVVYLRGHEGRGVGLAEKLRAYELQDRGRDTVDAQLELGLPVDARDYSVAASILADLGLTEVRLLTNNPAKVEGLRAHGVAVAAVERLRTTPLPTNAAYLRTKRDRMGHDLVLDPADDVTSA
ncbi:bifunctional 3,4-dihydroxy-2-butanone-4-phosphate synthase/GTP cyclohydrolase II [Phycicoccus sp. CSK15P-2]|uniref:bifunctional 3,4-dihydroxy-2-butanone-4-phosphate synthase/GTP cyclohydrolase II n=1 Tax=Phycicoccus sp. CSK15P-2 TaxID=2807627 RepID=UPI00194F41D3|nr:bifunctional 3,4-dihydroxy-2-butanone-4-phosphate synthase/GTP cyclohydrolase II [Phycicoccus sp. CSK15P-2]MBM6403762.1 bifunctional 3,4-dihydroxy-2-butanone-4-phosphate synthase/GTP cyclohydrolase II [Phycicoccus sp. CSK15P-2]